MSKTQYDDVNVANTSKERKMDIDNLESVIRYSLMPSLQHISAVNIIIALWHQAKFQHQLANLVYECRHISDLSDTRVLEMQQSIGVKVLARLAQLPVPNLMRAILSNIVGPIRQEIYNWMRVHERIFSNDSTWHISQNPTAINCMDYLVWTSRGQIDYKRTAKNLLDYMQLSNIDQYDLACTYCLEEDIATIAPKVIDTLNMNNFKSKAMMYFWTSHITGDFTKLDKEVISYNVRNRTYHTTNEWILNILLCDTINETAIKYIWDKLNHFEKSWQCVSVITRFSSIDFHCFILSQLNKEQQQRVFKACASKILLSLSGDWLWGTYFSPTLYHIWNIMTEGQYLDVLEGIVNKMEETNQYIKKYDSYRAAFKDSWQNAPAHLKKYVLELKNGYRCHKIFFMLFCKKNVDILQLILLDCNYAQKRNIIFSESCMFRCHQRINEQYGLLEILIEQSLVSEGVKESSELISYFNKKWNAEEQAQKWASYPRGDLKQLYEAFHSRSCRDIIKAIVFRYKGDFAQLERLCNW